MGLLDDYDFALGKPRRIMPPGTNSPSGPYMSQLVQDKAIDLARTGGTPSFGTGSPGFPPTQMDWKPAVPAPDSSAGKLQDRLDSSGSSPAFDMSETFSPKPLGPPQSFKPGMPDTKVAGFKPPFDTSRFDPVMASTVSPPTPVAAAPAPPVMPPSPKVGSAPPPASPSAGLLAPTPPAASKPTGVPTTAPPPSLTADVPLPPERPQGLGDGGGSPLASNPVSAINNITPPPVIPASTIGSPIGDFQKGGEFQDVAPSGGQDLGGGLGGDMGNGSDDLAFGGGGDSGGGDAGGGESGGGGDGGGAAGSAGSGASSALSARWPAVAVAAPRRRPHQSLSLRLHSSPRCRVTQAWRSARRVPNRS